PMLDRTDFTSWQQRIRLYCRGKENGVNILKSIDKGPFQMGIFRETLAEGTEGALGLPKDIYSLINHYTNAKDIWDNVKMLLEGSELTKEDCESQLYDDFEHFCQNKGENIHDYYVRFAKLINDIRNIKITMSRMQHEAHANENKMLLDRFTQHTVNPLALMSNVAPQQYNSQSSTNPSSTYVPPHFGAGIAGYEGALNKVRNANPGQARQNGVALDEEQLLFLVGRQDNVVDGDVDEQLV
ncbi:hypothetical protein Tco_1087533, partial [Tanacetum coccineum]